MKYDLAEFEKRVEQKLIRKVEKGDLILYNYTDKCTYDRAWDGYTMAARGIIFNKTTHEIVARPFKKFFNLGEMPETYVGNLPDEPYVVRDKLDGSLGIIYWHDNKWNIATRGSLSSEQAVKGAELLSKYDVDKLLTTCTYLVEIVYPENKIVVNYGNVEELVLLAGIHTELGIEVDDISKTAVVINMPGAHSHDLSIEEMIAMQKTLPKDKEGFVVRFQSGLRVKIKGEAYMKIHKMIANMSPLSFWESMIHGIVNTEYLAQLPEEYRNEFEPMVLKLETEYAKVWQSVQIDLNYVVSKEMSHRDIGLLIKEQPDALVHPGAIFSALNNKAESLDKYIMKTIRPTGNIL